MAATWDVLTGQEQQVEKRSTFMEEQNIAGKRGNKKKRGRNGRKLS